MTEREIIVKAAKGSLQKEEGREALNHLKNERHFSNVIIDKFNIGYCPISVDHVLRGRIITPIYDTYGTLIALSTRHLDRNIKNRFWHESFEKSFYLYGLNHARKYIQEKNKAIIVEGEFDVLSLHSRGFNMTVGCCGSALSLFQISILSRYCSEIYLMFDGDSAGKKSIDRTMKMYNYYHLDAFKLKFIPVYLPNELDPDDYLNQKGAKNLREKLIISRDNILLSKKE